MKPRILLLSLMTAALLVPAVRSADSTPVSDAPGKTVLSQGMTADEIVKLAGKPKTIRHLDNTANVNAEIWTYRILLKDEIAENGATVSQVPAFLGVMGNTEFTQTTTEIDYHIEHVRRYQVTALLMIDGQLGNARQWIEQSSGFED